MAEVVYNWERYWVPREGAIELPKRRKAVPRKSLSSKATAGKIKAVNWHHASTTAAEARML
jgi:hypothetical protein